jgi:hypothetical protein
MNDQENELRRELRAMVADPPRITPAAELVAAAQQRRRRDRAGMAALAVLVVAALAVPGVLTMRDAGTPQTPVAAEPSAPGPSAPTGAATGGPPAPPGTELATGPDNPAVGTSYRYDLFVHCGVRYAKFGGRWWRADPEQPEPRTTYGGGLYVPGTMALVAADEARFTSDTPKVSATFRPLAGDPEPCD